MNTYELQKLNNLCDMHASIITFGMNIDKRYVSKLVNDLDSASLIIINLRNITTIEDILTKLTKDSTVVLVDILHIEQQLERFFETKPNFQFSKLMMINGSRENNMTVIYNNPTTSIGDRVDQITIFLVLRSGGDTYDSRYVNATAKNIKEHLTYDAEIVCLTDNSDGITAVDRIVMMEHNWPKWWGKLEMFKPNMTKNKHCLYIDLDTVCFKNIDAICRLPADFYGIRDFYHLNVLQTGILKWEVGEDSQNLYIKNLHHIDKYFNKGDHELIGECVTNPKFLQDIFPGEICSYKKHMRRLYKNYINPTIVCFHGTPRPHTIKHDLIVNKWKY